jgi:starvation-inducible DNA-binding protein
MNTKNTHTPEAPEIGLAADHRERSAEILSRVLANQHVIYLKSRNFHWNLRGPRFHSLHEFFEKQYQTLEALIDKTAERIRMLGKASPGSMHEFLDLATLKESSGDLISGEDALDVLRADHESAARELREAVSELGEIGDAGTEDFATALLQAHEEAAWMLRSYAS